MPPTMPGRSELGRSEPLEVTAIVLCGGQSRRFGADKTRARLHGIPVLDWVLTSLPADWDVACVGEERVTKRPGVRWTREQPAGGGPVAGIAAGLTLVTTATVVVLGGDMPFAGRYAGQLAAAVPPPATPAPDATVGLDCVVAADEQGRLQPLLCAARTSALAAAMPREPGGQPLARLIRALAHRTVTLPAAATLDIDTPQDLLRAQLELGDDARTLGP